MNTSQRTAFRAMYKATCSIATLAERTLANRFNMNGITVEIFDGKTGQICAPGGEHEYFNYTYSNTPDGSLELLLSTTAGRILENTTLTFKGRDNIALFKQLDITVANYNNSL